MKNFFLLASIAIMVLSLFACSSDEEQTEIENPAVIDEASAFSGAPLLGDVVLENMYEDEARKLTDKTPVQIVTVLEGTNRVTLEAQFRGVRDFGFGYPLYEFELTDELAEAMGGIAQGMSGSPVGPPGRIMGALAYGDAFATAPRRFWVTSIDAMENAITHQTFGEMFDAERAGAAPGGIQAAYRPVKTPLTISGIQVNRLEQLSAHLEGSHFDFVQLIADINDAPAAPPTVTTRLAAGDMIGVAVSTGDVVNSIGFGTVTQVYDDGTFTAFGHPMVYGGQSSLPVYRAVTNGIVSNLQIPYKSSSAYGNPIGTITKDLLPGIVGELGTVPSMIPLKVTYQAGNGPIVEKNHKVAYGQESFLPIVAAITMDSIRQEISSATVDGTVTLRFKETETVYTESFRSASSATFIDVLINTERIIRAFTDTLSNSAGEATLADVSIAIHDKPQIMLADLHEVIVPEEGITPGEDLIVSVVLLPHWSAAGDKRTIEREVTLQVPEDFPAGDALLTVASENPFGPPDPFFGPDFFFFGPEEEPKPLPENLDELIKKMEEEQINPSLITITLESLGSPPGGLPPGFLPPDLLPPDFLPPDLLPPEGLPLPEDGEMPEDGEAPEGDEMPEDGEAPEGDEMPEDGEAPEGDEMPEDGEAPEDGEMPEDGEAPGDGEMPPDLLLPEGFPPLDGFPFPTDFEPPPSVEITINIDGFIVIGLKEAFVTIEGEEMGDGMIPGEILDGIIPEEIGEPVEPVEPAEPEEPAEEE